MYGDSNQPAPSAVRNNDWRQIDVAPAQEFVPVLPVSVIVPYYDAPKELALTLAALEGQRYPRHLFEVVVVDDGSPVPLAPPRSTPLDVKVVHQEDRGFGAARARNTGARTASHDILLFLDGDMLPESGWLAAHARWHHAAADVLTVGLRTHVAVEGVEATMVRERPGTLAELFEHRASSPEASVLRYLANSDELTSPGDHHFTVMVSANFGIGRRLYDEAGGFDESFTRWGLEDTEFAWRVYNQGGVLVPARDAQAWHQGLEPMNEYKRCSRRRQEAKVAHLIPHRNLRHARYGSSFAVPEYVVAIDAGQLPVEWVVEVTETVLAEPTHDLAVCIELPRNDPRRIALGERFGPEPRVRIDSPGSAVDAYPAAPLHVRLPANVNFAPDIAGRLRAALGPAARASAELADGSHVSITRAWALHRSRRCGRGVADVGEVVTTTAKALRIAGGPSLAYNAFGRVVERISRIRSARQAAAFLIRLPVYAGRWLRDMGGTASTDASTADAGCAVVLGAEIAAHGPRSEAVFAASRNAARPGRDHVDVLLCDASDAQTDEHEGRPVVLPETPSPIAVPAFDPLIDNPVGWRRHAEPVVGALGPTDDPACRAVRIDDREALRRIHHLVDVQRFHDGVATRAGELARLAANGVVVHVADDEPGLRGYLGTELHDLMAEPVTLSDAAERERRSILLRRAALRGHTLASRVRQVCAASGMPDPPRLPVVSVLLATNRPQRLAGALAAVARQTYPRLELVLGLHGDGFENVEPLLAELDEHAASAKVVRVDPEWPVGSALNTMTDASSGTLLAKMDDDAVYDADHLWDLILAHEYSQAPLVGKGLEFVYLAAADRTLRCFHRRTEAHLALPGAQVAGGALLVSRRALDEAGGWRRTTNDVTAALQKDIVRAGGCVYRTHGAGFVRIHDAEQGGQDQLAARAETSVRGWNPRLAGISGPVPPPTAADG